MNSPNLMAAVRRATDEAREVVIYGNLLPLHEPLRLAEELAMIDCLSNGRLIFGFARGIPREYQVHNVALSNSRARFEEAHEIITRAWTEDSSPIREGFGLIGMSHYGRDPYSGRIRKSGYRLSAAKTHRIRCEAQHPHYARAGSRRTTGRHHPLLRKMSRGARTCDHARPSVARPVGLCR